MRIIVCSAVVALLSVVGCGNDESLSLTRDGGIGGGGLDGSMNDRDMAAPPPDMATPRDMAVPIDTAVPIDMSAPDAFVVPTLVDETASPLGFVRSADIRDVKLVAIGDDDKAIDDSQLPGVAFVRDGADGVPHVYFTHATLTTRPDGLVYTWSEPENVSDTDTILDDSTTDGPRTRTMDLAFDATSQRLAIAYVAAGESDTDGRIIVRTRLVTESTWTRHDVTREGTGTKFAGKPAIGVEGGEVVVVYLQESTSCVPNPEDELLDIESCRRVVVAKFDPSEPISETSIETLSLLGEHGGLGASYTSHQIANIHPSITFDDRGRLAIAAFVEMNRHDRASTAAKVALWRDSWNNWESAAYGAQMLRDESSDEAGLKALSVAFSRGYFSIGFRGTPDVTNWTLDPPVTTPTPGIFVVSRRGADAFGREAWRLSVPIDTTTDSPVDNFGRSLKLVIDDFGQRTLIVERSVAADEASGAGPLLLPGYDGDAYYVAAALPQTRVADEGFSSSDFAARALDATLFDNHLLATIFVAPEWPGSYDGLWIKITAPKMPPEPCRLVAGDHHQPVTLHSESDELSPKLIYTRLLLDSNEEPILVYAESRYNDDYEEVVTISATRYTHLDPQGDACWWNEPLELAQYVSPSSDIPLRAEQIGAAFDAATNRIVVAFPVAYSFEDSKTYMRFAYANLDSAYAAEYTERALPDTAEVGELSSAELTLDGDTLHIAAARRFRDCFEIGDVCEKPTVLSYSAETFEFGEEQVIEIARTGKDFSIVYSARPTLQIALDGTQYLGWGQESYGFNPSTESPEYELEIVLAKKEPGALSFVSTTLVSSLSTEPRYLQGGEGELRIAHALVGFGEHILLTNLVPDVETRGYALYGYMDGSSATSFARSIDIPSSAHFEIVRGTGDLSIAGTFDYSSTSLHEGAGPYVGSVNLTTEPAMLTLDRIAASGSPPPPIRGEALATTFSDEAGMLLSYVSPNGYDDVAMMPLPGAVHIWRQR